MRRPGSAGGELETKHNYGGWRPDLRSAALAALKTTYERLFGEEPIVTGVHAGLETAVIGDKVAGLDMISFGPQIEAPHSPDERVSIPTVERFWKLLVGFVDEMSSRGEAMSRWLLVLLIVFGLGTILGVSAAVGNGDNTGETVSASDWADDVCGSVGAWEGQLESLRDELGQSNYGARRNDGGTGDSVERTLVVSGAIDRAVQITNDTLGEGLPRAGIPDVGQGEQASQILQDWADKTESDLRARSSRSTTMPTRRVARSARSAVRSELSRSAAVDGRAAFKQVSELDPELADALESSGNCQELMKEQP